MGRNIIIDNKTKIAKTPATLLLSHDRSLLLTLNLDSRTHLHRVSLGGKDPVILDRFRKLTHLQFAIDGRWEDAKVLHANVPPPSGSDVRNWIGQSTDFALEIFFTDSKGLPQFVGVRWTNEAVQYAGDLILAAHQTLERLTGSAASGQKVIREFEAALDVALLRSVPTFLELGVSNMWKSVGSLPIWRSPQPLPSRTEIAETLNARGRQLLNDQQNAVMLEFGYAEPQDHWVGLCVSHPVATGFRLELDEVFELMPAVRRPMNA